MAGRPVAEINPHTSSSLKITPATKVGSGGSCFAQNISAALQARGFHYFVTEPAPPHLPAETAQSYNYAVYSARYGNLYTPLQWLQLIQRSMGLFSPGDQYWRDGSGRYFDLLRPRINPRGFASLPELEADVRHHLRAVRTLFERVDVFVFTLGLTEGWQSAVDGTIYPTCPGCGNAGDFNQKRYLFRNFGVSETTEHLAQVVNLLASLNPALNVILTVSPVPLVATMEPRHVLQATTYSKSVLRVAAEQTALAFSNVHYFGSYEIIVGTGYTRSYFADDRRSVTRDGVDHVMKCFFELYADSSGIQSTSDRLEDSDRPRNLTIPAVLCDEEEFFKAVLATRKKAH
jgi:hypothetical protein